MFEGILFHLELMFQHRSAIYKESKVVLECPAHEAIEALELKYKVPGLLVVVTCEPLRGVPM